MGEWWIYWSKLYQYHCIKHRWHNANSLKYQYSINFSDKTIYLENFLKWHVYKFTDKFQSLQTSEHNLEVSRMVQCSLNLVTLFMYWQNSFQQQLASWTNQPQKDTRLSPAPPHALPDRPQQTSAILRPRLPGQLVTSEDLQGLQMISRVSPEVLLKSNSYDVISRDPTLHCVALCPMNGSRRVAVLLHEKGLKKIEWRAEGINFRTINPG